ncbi:MAG: T9SS type A sorting domain-containing protein [Bacteroidia bacterium]
MKRVLLSIALFSSAVVLADPGDTLGVTFGTTPTFAPNNQAILLPYVLQGGYVYGVNGDPNELNAIAQGYILEDPSTVEGVLMFVGAKTKGPANIPNTRLTFNLFQMSATGAQKITSPNPFASVPVEGPGSTVLASGQLFFEEIDTASLAYSYVGFTVPAQVNGNIAVGVDLTDLKTAGDTVGFICDNLGSANGIDYAFHRAGSGQTAVWYTTNSLFGGALDNNIAIFPVLTAPEPSSIGDEISFMGLSTSVYPNPVSNTLNVTLSLETSENAHLTLLQATGNAVVSSLRVKAGKVKTTHQLDVSNVSAGNYILLIEGENGERTARKVIITRQ